MIFVGAGLSSNNVAVEIRSTFSFQGDQLSVVLENVSSEPILNPSELLSSRYFDIVDAKGARPTLLNYLALGDVYRVWDDAADVLQTSGADLVAAAKFDETWQFKTFALNQLPFAAFGVGTVGNSGLSPNGFNGDIVGAINYSIYTGEITTRNLDGRLLVKDRIEFAFTGVNGLSENDVRNVVFGLGTGPDRIIYGQAIPEPAATVFLAAWGMLAICFRLRRQVASNIKRNAAG